MPLRNTHIELEKKEQIFQNVTYSLKTEVIIITVFRVMKSKTLCRKLLDENQLPTTDPSNIVELFRSYFSKVSNSPTSHVSDDMDMLEAISFTHDDQILDTDIIVEEIVAAFIALKCGRSKGADGLNSEHLIYGGDSLKL